MRKVLLLLVGTAVLWLPAVSVAGDSSPSQPAKLAAKKETPQVKSEASSRASTCKSQRSDSNFASSHHGQTFTQSYGPNDGSKGRGAGVNAFGKCVSTIAAHMAQNDGKDSAESQGKESDGKEGEGKEGEGKEGEGKEGEGKESEGKDSANPAMTCKSMQSNDLTHFQAAFGARPNAFGKCVAKQANSKKS